MCSPKFFLRLCLQTVTTPHAMDRIASCMVDLQAIGHAHRSSYELFQKTVFGVEDCFSRLDMGPDSSMDALSAVDRSVRANSGSLCASCLAPAGPAGQVKLGIQLRPRSGDESISVTIRAYHLMLGCIKCHCAVYCSLECQRQHWVQGLHKRHCKQFARILGLVKVVLTIRHRFISILGPDALTTLPSVGRYSLICRLPLLSIDSSLIQGISPGSLTQRYDTVLQLGIDYLTGPECLLRDGLTCSLSGIYGVGLVDDVNVLRLYTPTADVMDTGGALDARGLLRFTRGTAWRLRPTPLATALRVELQHIADKYSVEIGVVEMVSLQLRVKRARGYMAMFFMMSSIQTGQWIILEEPRLFQRIKRHTPGVHTRMCRLFGIPLQSAGE